MKTELTLPSVNLLKDELHLIRDGRGRHVQTLSGRLWITQEGDPRDIVLDAGEGFTVEQPGLTVVCALRPSSLLVLDHVSAAPHDPSQVKRPFWGGLGHMADVMR